MRSRSILIIAYAVSMSQSHALAGQAERPSQTEQPKAVRPAPKLSLIDSVKRYVQKFGGTVDEAKSTADMVVSSYAGSRGGKINIVIVNDQKKALLGFYIYNFGNIKDLENPAEIEKYLLAANDAITIGAFFVDKDQDIGYKYLMSNQQLNQGTFDAVFRTMAAVAGDRRIEIKRILGYPVEGRTTRDGSAEAQPPSDQGPALLPEKEDSGIDLAVVTATRANVRTGPGMDTAVLLEVGRGQQLVLLDRQPDGQWYNVVQVDSGTEGWVHSNAVRLAYTNKKNTTTVFAAERVDTRSAPLIEVSNGSDQDLSLRLGSAVHRIPAHSRQAFSVSAGEYKYCGLAPGATPVIGKDTFQTGYKYSWTFWIQR
jgi:hypothetical protein